MMLGDSGAEVIKVESIDQGDITRGWGPPFIPHIDNPDRKESCYFIAVNRNKKSIALDFKSDQGKEIIEKLVKKSDVLIENFPTGKLEKLGLGYDRLKEMNPSLIYASITGYGPTGPYASRPGYDVIAAAEGGLMSFTGEEGRPPVKVGVAITDICTGLTLHGAILTALLYRERSEEKLGQKIDTSLYEVQISVLANIASNYLNANVLPKRLGTSHESIVPYRAYQTKDNLYHILGAGNDHQFKTLCESIGLEDLVQDPRFKTNADRVAHRKEIDSSIESKMKTRTLSEWQSLLSFQGFPNGPITSLDTLFSNDQISAREMILEFTHPNLGLLRTLGFPVKFSSTPCSFHHPPPLLGEHSDSILLDLGYSHPQIAEMRHLRIIH
jgi:succinate--hydroxymethylglutarate CoA-transferase